MHTLEIAYTQHSGLHRTMQQDALWSGQALCQTKDQRTVQITHREASSFIAVADGVSASPAPQLASRFVIETLVASLNNTPHSELDVRQVRRVHGLLCDRYAHGRTFGSSTTLVATQIVGRRCITVNAGDSRAYRILADGSWQPLSRDHTVIESLRLKGQASCDQEYARIYDALDTLLLCSDGVHQTIGQQMLEQLFDPHLSTYTQVDIFRTAVLNAGAPDNFSLILARHGQC